MIENVTVKVCVARKSNLCLKRKLMFSVSDYRNKNTFGCWRLFNTNHCPCELFWCIWDTPKL